MFSRLLGLSLLLLAMVAGVVAAESPFVELKFPVPAPGAESVVFGTNVQRTMTLLATSTPEKRNHVRILVYGQSISEGIWWREVDRVLRERFPNADIELQNRALGGHASNYLVREGETDLYPYYPDLVIFHVYGAHTCYEQIISRIRSRTAAEVLVTTDHLGGDEKPDACGKYHDAGWGGFMASFVDQVTRRYGCERVDVREPWKQYVIDNKLSPKDLLIDGIHLNKHGNGLYAALINRQLVYRPELPIANAGMVRTYEVGKDIQWKDGKLVVEFAGNRVDAIAETGDAVAANVTIDGRKPSEFTGAYAFTRAQSEMGKILCIIPEKTPQVEEWTMRVTGVDKAAKSFTFEAIGSKTGADGNGVSNKRFVSNSGRIVIETDVEKPEMRNESDWGVDVNNVKVGQEIKFNCFALHADRFVAPKIADPTKEYAVTLAQGIPNEKHTLVLTAEGAGKAPIKFIRVYQPPMAAPADGMMLYQILKKQQAALKAEQAGK